MTILIADDEELIRFTIKDMLKEISYGSSVFVEAASGTELITQYRKYHPDVIMVDIKMPGKNGLEAMEELNNGNNCFWVVLSGYSDFSYLRKAMQLKACDYLLKPPSPKELKEVLLKAEEWQQNNFNHINREFEASLNSVYNKTSEAESHSLLFRPGYWRGLIICQDSMISQKEALIHRINLCRHIRNDLFGRQQKNRSCALITRDEGVLLVIIYSPLSMKDDLPFLLPQIQLDREQGTELSFFPVGEKESIQLFNREVEKTMKQTLYRFIKGSENPTTQETEICLNLEKYLVEPKKSREAETLLNEIYLTHSHLSQENQDNLLSFLKKLFPLLREEMDLSSSLEKLRESPLESEERGISLLAEQACRLVKEKYSQDIGIAQIAYELNVTPNYLSTLFRNQKGIKFTRYLTNMRIEKAKSLLARSQYSVKEIAAQVGYQGSRYFSGLFRQETGISPTEYINRHRV